MVPGAIDPALFGLERDAIARMPPEEYCARVLAAICRSALEHRDEQALFVDYRELPGAVFDRILGAFGIVCDAGELARDERGGRLRREEPGLSSSRPTTRRRSTRLSPALREAADRWVRPVYEELLAC